MATLGDAHQLTFATQRRARATPGLQRAGSSVGPRRMGPGAPAALPRSDVSLRGAAKARQPQLLQRQGPISIQAQMIGAVRTEPHPLARQPPDAVRQPIGVVIAYSEVAIGLGALLGLWTRVAAIGGALLSLSLFLDGELSRVALLHGRGHRLLLRVDAVHRGGRRVALSLDAKIADAAATRGWALTTRTRADRLREGPELCGNSRQGHVRRPRGLPCDAGLCPVLLGDRAPDGDASRTSTRSTGERPGTRRGRRRRR